MTVALWSNCPGREMGSCNPLPEHQDQAGKQIQIQIQRDRVSWKRTEFSVPRDCSSKACHKKEKKEEYKNRLPLREKNEFSAPLLTTDHQKCGKGGKQGNRNIAFFLQSFMTRLMITKVWSSMFDDDYVWSSWKKSRTGVQPKLSRKMCLSYKVFDKTITDSEKIRKVYPALIW